MDLGASRLLQRLNHFFDMLCMSLICDEEGVWCIDDDEVLESEECDEASLSEGQAIFGLVCVDIALEGILVSVFFHLGVDGLPGAHIGPSEVHGDHVDVLGFFE